jgi:coenzyme F420-reducing hydrogenase beta subunit
MKKQNIKETTLKYNLCINCGICKAACDFNAIEMIKNKYGELNPVINFKRCKNCNMCSVVCPNSKLKLQNEAKKIVAIQEPQTYGLQNASYYLAWDSDKAQRQKCCSGGAVTKLATYLLKNRKIDGVIHVERKWAHRGELHYGARLSSTVEEIKENVSSAYQPIDFSEILLSLQKDKTYFMTGTPCVIRGIKELIERKKDFNNIKILTCALVCSHNTNAQFIDFLTEMNELCDKKEWKINIRYKDSSIPDANNFKNFVYTKEGELFKKNRFESKWTDIWRGYYFAMNACLYCSDFWGYEADISVKDAWGKWASDPLGKSIVVIRNQNLLQDFMNSGINCEILDYETMKNHQIGTSNFKQIQSYNKNFKSILSKSNRRNGLFRYSIVSKSTKFLYKNFGYKLTKSILPIIEWCANIGEKL